MFSPVKRKRTGSDSHSDVLMSPGMKGPPDLASPATKRQKPSPPDKLSFITSSPKRYRLPKKSVHGAVPPAPPSPSRRSPSGDVVPSTPLGGPPKLVRQGSHRCLQEEFTESSANTSTTTCGTTPSSSSPLKRHVPTDTLSPSGLSDGCSPCSQRSRASDRSFGNELFSPLYARGGLQKGTSPKSLTIDLKIAMGEETERDPFLEIDAARDLSTFTDLPDVTMPVLRKRSYSFTASDGDDDKHIGDENDENDPNNADLCDAAAPTPLCEAGREHGEDAEVSEDVDDYEEFDPYIFIGSLPPLTAEQKARQPMLAKKLPNLPPVTLVLDLDETLVHCSTEYLPNADMVFPVEFNSQLYQVYVRKRPYLYEFLEFVRTRFEVVVFTASQEIYASKLLNILDPDQYYIRSRLYRESCVFVEGNYLKDLNILGRDLAQMAIIDNSPQAFAYQLNNGIPIESWFDEPDDKELLNLLPLLSRLCEASDVRPHIRDEFGSEARVDRGRRLVQQHVT